MAIDTALAIKRQVWLKIASEQVADAERLPDVKELVAYAKQLEEACTGWL